MLMKEVVAGFAVISQSGETDFHDAQKRGRIVDDIYAGIKEYKLWHSLYWDKFNYLHSAYSDDILIVPMAFFGERQKYIVVCRPEQESMVIGSEARIIKRIPMPSGFKGQDYNANVTDRNIVIVEEPRIRYYYGTWRGTILEIASKGKMGRTLVPSYDSAVEYTCVTTRGTMRSMFDQERNVFRSFDVIKRLLKRKNIRISESENGGVGYGVVLEYWGDLILPGFVNNAHSIPSIELNKNQPAVSLNCLTEKSKETFLILAGITHKLKWMDDSWDNIKFPERALTSEEIINVMSERGTELFNLDGREMTSAYRHIVESA